MPKANLKDKFTCKNCYIEHTGKFCPNCGQKVIIKHSFRSVFSGIFEIVELERGFFKTFLDIIRRPKKFLESYLNGKTKPYTNPVLFYIILNSFFVLLFDLMIGNKIESTEIEIKTYLLLTPLIINIYNFIIAILFSKNKKTAS